MLGSVLDACGPLGWAGRRLAAAASAFAEGTLVDLRVLSLDSGSDLGSEASGGLRESAPGCVMLGEGEMKMYQQM